MSDRRNLSVKNVLALACASALYSSGTTAVQLEEIVVTANKVEESLQEVPLAVSAIGGDDLAHSGVAEAADLSGRVPNLQVSSPYANIQPNFSLRGISVGNEFNANQASPIGVYVDQNYLSARFAHGMQLYDIDQVEVLRGPQGTLYGRNTTGGVINVITRKPLMEQTQGYLTAKVGRFDSRELAGAVDTQLIDDVLGLRVAGTWSQSDGQLDNVGSGNGGDDYRANDSQAARASLLWLVNDDIELSVRAYYSDAEADGDAAIGLGVMPGGTDISGYSGADLDFWESEAGQNGDYGASGDGLAATLTWTLNEQLELTSITAFDQGDFRVEQDADGGPADIFNITWSADYDQFNQELRLKWEGDSVRVTAGVYYGTDDVDTRNHYNFFGMLGNPIFGFVFPPNFPAAQAALASGNVPFGLVGNLSAMNVAHRFDQSRDSQAVFGEAAWDINERIRLTFGLRYTKDSIEVSNAQAIFSDYTGTPQLNTLPLVVPADGNAFLPAIDKDYNDVSGRIILDYTFDSGNMMYLSYSKGYRAGAINGTAYFDPSQLTFVEPENLDAYEFGWKTRMLDESVQLNGAIFYYDYTDQQVQEIVNITPFLRNSGEATVKGLELEALYAATDSLVVGFNLGVIDSEYKDLTLCGVDLSGNEFTNTPEMTANFNIDWEALEMAGGMLSVRADVTYIGDQWFSPFNEKNGNQQLQQSAYSLINGRVSWHRENLSLALWGRNLTDKEYYSYGLDLRNITGADYLVRGARRTYGVEVSYTF